MDAPDDDAESSFELESRAEAVDGFGLAPEAASPAGIGRARWLSKTAVTDAKQQATNSSFSSTSTPVKVKSEALMAAAISAMSSLPGIDIRLSDLVCD
ncbi:MAG: hypothetical protein AAF756_18690 [Pseudomonadota bacterium]